MLRRAASMLGLRAGRDLTLDALLDRACGQPLALYEPKVRALQEALARRGAGERLTADQIESLRAEWRAHVANGSDPSAPRALSREEDQDPAPVAMTLIDGVAVLEVRGAMIKGEAGWRASVGMVGYDDIHDALLSSFQDPRASSVLMVLESPGGDANGMLELMDRVSEMRAALREAGADKPLGVYCDGMAASAGYGVASLADPGMLWAYESAIVGNIGVYSLVYDQTRALDAQGITVHLTQYPDRKTVGNPNRALTDDDRSMLDERTRDMAYMFFERVARNRGTTADAVAALRGEWFLAGKAEGTGLVDDTCLLSDAIAAMSAATPDSSLPPLAGKERPTMAFKLKNRPAAKAELPPEDQVTAEDLKNAYPNRLKEISEEEDKAKTEDDTKAEEHDGAPAPAPEPEAPAEDDAKKATVSTPATFAELCAANLAPETIVAAQSKGWTVAAAVAHERDALRARVATLEKSVDEARRAHLAQNLGRQNPVDAPADPSSAAFRSSGDPERDWKHPALQAAYAERFGQKGTRQAFLRTAAAMLRSDDTGADYRSWVEQLAAND